METSVLLWMSEGREAAIRAHWTGYGGWAMLRNLKIAIWKKAVTDLTLTPFFWWASSCHWNKYSIETQWVTVIFLIHIVRSPGVENFLLQIEGFNWTKAEEIWNHIAFCKVMSMLYFANWWWEWEGAVHDPPRPNVPSIYLGPCVCVQNHPPVDLVCIATIWLDFPQEKNFLISDLSMHLHFILSICILALQ